MTTTNMTVQAPRRPSIGLPLILITVGVLFLLVNAGVIIGLRWSDLARVAPVVLVLIGVDMLLRSRSWIVAAAADIAIIAATLAYVLSSTAGVTLSYATDIPREGVTDLRVTVNYGAGAVHLSGGATDLVSVRSTQEDVQRTVDQTGSRASVTLSSGPTGRFTIDGRDRQWDVLLPNDVPTALTMNLGAGSYDIDLSDVRLVRGTLNGGASSFALRLGRPTGDVPIKISAGMASFDLVIPQGVAYRVRHTGFMQSLTGPTSTDDYATAADRFTIELSSAMSSVTIR